MSTDAAAPHSDEPSSEERATDPAPEAEAPPAADAPPTEAPATQTPAETAAPEAEAPTPAADEAPAPDPAPQADAPQADAPQSDQAPAPDPAPEAEAPADAAPQAEASADANSDAAPPADAPAAAASDAKAADDDRKGKPKAKRQRRRPPRVPDLPKTRAPLPLDELRDASRSTLELFGPQQAVRDAFAVLGAKERQDISALIAQDEDHRPRTRNIANGSLGAGRIDKAMGATILSMVRQEDLWAATLDKELAAQKLGRIRQAKQRDQQRADRAKERANRADRVSREDMAKATDGRVGATIRFVTDDRGRDRSKQPEPEAPPAKKRSSVLDELGY